MLTLLDKALQEGALRTLDVQFARMIACEHEPEIMLAAAFLSNEASAGHICLLLEQLRPEILFSGGYPQLAQTIWQALGEPSLADWQQWLTASSAVSDGSEPAPLVLQHNRLYLQRMWQYEKQVAAFMASNHALLAAQEDKIRHILDKLFGTHLPLDWQKIAAAVALTRRIAVIAGGPGTGKTSTVAKLLAALIQLAEKANLRIQLTAPTGKAAARLTESLGRAVSRLALSSEQLALLPAQAMTLHRLLGIKPDSQMGRYDSNNPLHLDVLIVDEASMIDLPMMARLIAALPNHARVIFLGDHDQLASVEAGAVLGDMCRFIEQGYSRERAAQLFRLTGCCLEQQPLSSANSVISDSLCLLRESFRFDAASGIGQLAQAINAGDKKRACMVLTQNRQDIVYHTVENKQEYEALIENCVAGYSHYLRAVAAGERAESILAAFSRFQVLCALRAGPFGVVGLNEHIEKRLLQAGMIARLEKGASWYQGRPIMIARNDNALGLYNGDIGIALYDAESGKLRVFFQLPDGKIKSVQPSRLPAHETAFAMTVHKSQGSEFEHTLLVLPNHFSPILTRELVYTAVTRARSQLSLYLRLSILQAAIDNRTLRRSGLIERFSTVEKIIY